MRVRITTVEQTTERWCSRTIASSHWPDCRGTGCDLQRSRRALAANEHEVRSQSAQRMVRARLAVHAAARKRGAAGSLWLPGSEAVRSKLHAGSDPTSTPGFLRQS